MKIKLSHSPFSIVAVEHGHRSVRAEPHDIAKIVGLVACEGDPGIRRERLIDVNSGKRLNHGNHDSRWIGFGKQW